MTQKAVFIDRDDTLVDDPGLITNSQQLHLLPGAAQALGQLRKLGYLIFIVTNQPCIARGDLTEIQLEEIHRTLKKMLTDEGATVDGIYYCPYDPNGTVKEYAIESDLRKPQPGMLLKAAADHDVDLDHSWMIGDRFGDIRAGSAAGCRTILVDVPGKLREQKPGDPDPDRKAVNLREAVNIIRMFEFHQKARNVRETTKPSDQRAPSSLAKSNHSAPSPEQKPAIEEETAISEATPTPESTTAESLTPEVPISGAEKPVAVEEPPNTAVNSGKVYTAKKTPAAESPTEGVESDQAKTHRMLEETLRLLKKNDREDLYQSDFSIFKLLALLFQAVAGLCLIFSIWFWLSPERGVDTVLIIIGYAAVLQLAVIALMMYSSE